MRLHILNLASKNLGERSRLQTQVAIPFRILRNKAIKEYV